MESIYIETSIISYLVARPSRNLISAARQRITCDWWENQRQSYQNFVSELVIAESAKGDKDAVSLRFNALKKIPVLSIEKECAGIWRTHILSENYNKYPMLKIWFYLLSVHHRRWNLNNQKIKSKKPHDEVIEELWKIKDNYSEACSSNFSQLIRNVKKDIEHMHYDLVRDRNIQNVA